MIRRTFLGRAATLAAMPVLPLGPPFARGGRRTNDVSGIDPDRIVDEYRARRLEQLSDVELARRVGQIVSIPCEGIISFTLHAPLELLARQALLPLVEPGGRESARIQMVASASVYEDGTRPITSASSGSEASAGGDRRAAAAALEAAIARGDVDAVEAGALDYAEQYGADTLVETLATTCLISLHAAAHSHIGLWLLLRHGRAGDDRPDLLRASVRHVATRPPEPLRSFDGLTASGDRPLAMSPLEVEQRITEALADPPRGTKGNAIRPALRAAEKDGLPERLFGELFRHTWSGEQMSAAYRALLRMSARAMLQDDTDAAKFGWSHCLTQPQAAGGLARAGVAPRATLAASFVYLTAYRCNASRIALDAKWQPAPVDASVTEALQDSPAVAAARFWHARADERALLRRRLATEASIRNDQHLVKYVRSCFDAAEVDPGSAHVFDAAAAYLAALWMAEVPSGHELDDLSAGRETPS